MNVRLGGGVDFKNISSFYLLRLLSAIWPLILAFRANKLSYFKKLRKGFLRNFRGSSKDPLFYLRVFSILILFFLILGLTFFPLPDFPKFKIPSFSKNKIKNEDYFLNQNQILKTETLSFNLIEGNSLVSFSVPFIPQTKVLASLSLEDNSQGESREVIEYIVQPGDNLKQLSEKFGISTNTIIWANQLSQNSKLKIGQKLIILPVSGVLHYVKKGETLNQIAKIYQADINKILTFNEISEDEISSGDVLIIPDGRLPELKKSVPKSFSFSQVPLANSYFIFPTQGRISQGLHWYNAVDIASPCGTPIYAAAQGEVIKTKFGNSGLGNYIVISHPNETLTYYGHLQSILVKPGEKVSQGEIIGYMGRTGLATGCHLHFEVRGAKNPFVS